MGDRRLRPSMPAQPWKGTLEATRGVICPQHPPRFTPPHLERSEDCLVLNIWTPAHATAKSKLPVLVFVHGGAFYVGSGLDNYANPHNLTQVRMKLAQPRTSILNHAIIVLERCNICQHQLPSRVPGIFSAPSIDTRRSVATLQFWAARSTYRSRLDQQTHWCIWRR